MRLRDSSLKERFSKHVLHCFDPLNQEQAVRRQCDKKMYVIGPDGIAPNCHGMLGMRVGGESPQA